MRWFRLFVLLLGWSAVGVQPAILEILRPGMVRDLAIAEADFLAIRMAFFIGMAAGYLLMAGFMMRYGTRRGLMLSLAGATLVAFLSGLAGGRTFLIVTQSLMGCFSSAFLPAAMQGVQDWFSVTLRPVAIMLVLTFGPIRLLGVAFAGICANYEMEWRTILMLSGVPVLMAGVLYFVFSKPGGVTIENGEQRARRSAWAPVGALGWGLFFGAPVSMFSSLLLFPLQKDLKLSLEQVGMFAGGVSLAGAVGNLLAGLGAWFLVRRGMGAGKTRRILLSVSGCLLAATVVPPPRGHLFWVWLSAAIGLFAYRAWGPLLYWGIVDELPRRRVVGGAAVGALGALLGKALSPVVTAPLFTWDYRWTYAAIGGAALVAALGVLWLMWVKSREKITTVNPELPLAEPRT